MSFQNRLNQISPWGKLVLLVALMAIGTLSVLSILFTLNEIFFHFPLDVVNHLSSTSSVRSIQAAKIIQITTQIGLFVIPTICFAFLTSPKLSIGIGWEYHTKITGYFVVIGATILAIPFINILAEWNTELHLPDFLEPLETWMRTTQATNDEMLRILAPMNSPMDVGINVLMMAILPAFGEELLFRGVLQRQFHKIVGNPHMAIMLTAIIFSAIHLQFLGFFSRAILGMLFGYLFYFSRNIWLPIIAHFINNFLALMLILLYGIDSMETSMENWVTGPFVLFSITSIAAAAFMVYSYRNSFQSTEV